jgi:two-component system, chemotaxis family, protein-glutamate methylesterase/glutaminase
MSTSTDGKRDTIVLGASAGGIEALLRLLPAFTTGVEASVFVVQHTSADGQSMLDQVLDRVTAYRAAFAQDGEVITTRRVYVAPPNRHLLIQGGRIRLWHGSRENRARPAIDPLFRSAGVARGSRVVAGVLSGMLDDGASGLLSVKRCGGLAFVQSPADAMESEMPERAAEALGDGLDGTLSADELGRRMVELMGTPAPEAPPVPDDVTFEMEMLLGDVSALEVLSKQGPPLPLSCPECGGPLWSLREGRVQRYRCHTGHTYGVDSLLSGQGNQIEQALWAAIKGLEQHSQMLANLAKDEGVRRRPASASVFEGEAAQLRRHATTLREVLVASFRDTRHRG